MLVNNPIVLLQEILRKLFKKIMNHLASGAVLWGRSVMVETI
jgi:hypothetical protein